MGAENGLQRTDRDRDEQDVLIQDRAEALALHRQECAPPNAALSGRDAGDCRQRLDICRGVHKGVLQAARLEDVLHCKVVFAIGEGAAIAAQPQRGCNGGEVGAR